MAIWLSWKHKRELRGDGVVLYAASEGGTLMYTCDKLT